MLLFFVCFSVLSVQWYRWHRVPYIADEVSTIWIYICEHTQWERKKKVIIVTYTTMHREKMKFFGCWSACPKAERLQRWTCVLCDWNLVHDLTGTETWIEQQHCTMNMTQWVARVTCLIFQHTASNAVECRALARRSMRLTVCVCVSMRVWCVAIVISQYISCIHTMLYMLALSVHNSTNGK